ncbi:serine hydrolase domain-containing protein [Actinomycetospora cinnamomea]|uniref:CubicO group peptidase (Beta-lactamase class C family) n=1 Tax=Actinomycetospora cinnamomea TaxID=663609 RepID=A0A2U1FFK8_9PSEU|nr:serine hydrolase domain-containing protein [Actinomycetospora cinnamomea]PVZ10985.1 CubicO group peptidase (beta-lactamase class C family) [Actinomycetospora cinnamomea]
MQSLALIDDWPVEHAAVGVVGADGAVRGTRGDSARRFPLASVTKPLVAWAALVAVEEEAVTLDQPAGPEGATVRHLLAHTSGLAFGEHRAVAEPGARRLYSSAGFEVLAATIEEATGIAFADYLHEALLAPLGMTSTTLDGSPGHGATSTVDDLLRLAAEMQAPTLLHPETVREAITVQFPGLNGTIPGFGHQKPNDWGLGVELRDGKSPHWTGERNSPGTFGHFGQSGTFLWVDPDAGAACVALTDRDFGDWAKSAWPSFSDAVLADLGT